MFSFGLFRLSTYGLETTFYLCALCCLYIYLLDNLKENKTFYGVIRDKNLVNRIEGNIYEDYVETQQKDEIIKILAPIIPKDIFCIGLNYKKHAEESNTKIPDYPVVFMKNTG